MDRFDTRCGRLLAALLVAGAFAQSVASQGTKSITLPAPDKAGGRPFMQVLSDRRTQREFSAEKLPLPVLSNLLWAAFGVNRPDGHRTAPSARNWQEVDVYVAMADALYVYEPKPHALRPVLAEDLRAATGTQDFVGQAPINLVYVADLARMRGVTAADQQQMYAGADVGFIAQNVYLFCASEGLATVVRASVDKNALAGRMKLRPDQRIVLAQTVGYPK